MPSEPHEGLPMPQRIWAVIAISFGTSLFVVDGAIATVALPTIAQELGISHGDVTNVVTVYQMVLVMLLLPFSSVGDRIGHRRLYEIGQTVFLLGSGAAYFADNFGLLLVVRGLQAVGAGMALSVSAAMLREIYPARSLGSGMGINSVIVASSAALAPTLGGYIVANADWRWVFIAAAPLAAISLILGRALPPPVKRPHETEYVSGIWSAITVLLLVGGLQLATHGAGLEVGGAVLVVGILSTVLLVRRERRRPRPVLPVDLLAQPVIGLSALASICAFIATSALMISLPFRLEEVLGYPPDKVGMLLLPFPLTMLFFAPLGGWLSDKVAPAKLGVAGMSVAILSLVLMATMPVEAGETGIAWRLALAAVGFALFFAPNSRLLIGRAPKDRAAAAGGLLSTARLLGQTLGAALVGILLAGGLGLGPAPLFLACGMAVIAALCSIARFMTARGRMADVRKSKDRVGDPAN